jgi:Mg-chelatase subunit ChlD
LAFALAFETRGLPADSDDLFADTDPHAELAEHYQIDPNHLDGWSIAEQLSKLGKEIADPQLRAFARKIAAKSVLRRAARLVGPIRPALRRIVEPFREPFRGELDIDRTLDNALGRRRPKPEDWMISDRREKQPQVVLMMDVSLSMSGRNLALAALATAVLAFKIRPPDLAVIAFDSSARTLHELGQSIGRQRLVESILAQPARGFTNLEEALRCGARELHRARSMDRAAILITDGVYTTGGDPLPLASNFRNLHVILTEDYKMNEDLCRRMANAGKGKLFKVKGFEDLPARMLDIANRVLR